MSKKLELYALSFELKTGN